MKFIALTSIGVENLLSDEIKEAGASVLKQSIGSIRFECDSLTAQRLCLTSRFATRIMLLFESSDEIKCKDSLYQFVKLQPWQEYFGPTQTFLVDFKGTNTQLKNTQFSALMVKDAVVDYFYDLYEKRPNIDKANPDVRIVARLNKEKLELYIDYSGPSLSRRGYRPHQGKAPIKEHVAAAVVKRSGWLNDIKQPLFDPCCGSGTLLIEAAMMALNIAPGLYRDKFAFESLPSFRAQKFKVLKQELKDAKRDVALHLIGHDIDKNVLQKARQNISQLPFEKYVKLQHSDANKLTRVANRQGVIVSNLPYGERLGETAELVSLYRNLGDGLKKHYGEWSLCLLGTETSLFSLLKIAKHKQYKLKNGPLDCLLNLYKLTQQQVAQSGKSSSLHYEQSTAFSNRLKKNKQALKSWLKTNDVDSYRLYDADIPEYNVAVDKYQDKVVVYEYAPPKTIDAETADKRLQDVIYLVSQTLDVDPHNVIVKQRRQQKGKNQYQSLSTKKESQVVNEYGAKFKVNLYDYLDTGLFLDHRLARRYLRENAKEKRVLNLFAYTGTASVQAALGGAKSVTTIDMSNTYLNWAKDNFKLNNLTSRRYYFEQADCLKWLEHARGEFDLIFLDPPTFSNSKRMAAEFDVQRDHIKLLSWVKKILSKEGTLLFSNNKRNFKIDEEGLLDLGLIAKNISESTLSPDFKRNKQIHNSWLITHA